jgi:hypothetical protein
VFFDAEELEVHAIVPAPGGGLFVGTSPDGKVYKVDARGTGTVFFDPADRYIWSLALDRAGNLFVATGDKGVIYKVTPQGASSKFYETKATHAMALAFDRDGRLLAGTESPGRVFRIEPNGRPFVVLDSSYSEIRALRLDQAGNAYALAVSGRGPSTGGSTTPPTPSADTSAAPTASVSTEISAVVVVNDAGPGASSSDAGTGAQHRARPAARCSESRRTASPTPSGSRARIRRTTSRWSRVAPCSSPPETRGRSTACRVIRCNPRWWRAPTPSRSRRSCASRMARRCLPPRTPGRLMRLSNGSATRGTYTSDVRDAQTVATWGTLRWQARTPQGTRVEIATRSGNTRTPDETWSDWTAAYADAEGTAITSPRARYLQWRAVLTGARNESPVLTSVTAAYLPATRGPV